MLGLYKQSLV